jgi:hypothetical protein
MPFTLGEIMSRLVSFIEFKGEARRRTPLTMWDISFAAVVIFAVLAIATFLVYLGVLRPK